MARSARQSRSADWPSGATEPGVLIVSCLEPAPCDDQQGLEGIWTWVQYGFDCRRQRLLQSPTAGTSQCANFQKDCLRVSARCAGGSVSSFKLLLIHRVWKGGCDAAKSLADEGGHDRR